MGEPRHVIRTIHAQAMRVPHVGAQRAWDDLEWWLAERNITHSVERDDDGDRHRIYLRGQGADPAEVMALPGDWIVDDDHDVLGRVWLADDFDAMFTPAEMER